MALDELHRQLPERQLRLMRIRHALCCPACRGDLTDNQTGLVCAACHATYPIRCARIYFVEPPFAYDNLDRLKYHLKTLLGKLYYTIGVAIIAPTFPFNYRAAIHKHVDPAKRLVVDIGAGAHRVDPDLITVDLFDYSSIDIVCDLAHLPFRDNSVDAFASRSVLEHVPHLTSIASRLAAATRNGGLGLHLVPFMYPFHASPHDYQRLTHVGAATLFAGFELVEQHNATGPFTLLTLLLTDFLAAVCSFGKDRLRAPLYLLFCVILFPVKFLDFPFIGRHSMLRLAPTIFTVTRKTSR